MYHKLVKTKQRSGSLNKNHKLVQIIKLNRRRGSSDKEKKIYFCLKELNCS